MSFGLEVWDERGIKTFGVGDENALLSEIIYRSFASNGGTRTFDFSAYGSKILLEGCGKQGALTVRTSVSVSIAGAKITISDSGSGSVWFRILVMK